MKRIALLVLLMAGCESPEARLERCKNQMRAQLKEMTAIWEAYSKDIAKPDTIVRPPNPMLFEYDDKMKKLPSIIAHMEAKIATMSGPEGFARCEEMRKDLLPSW